MKIFKKYTFEWWQVAILKLSILSLGIIIGSYWYTYFETVLTFPILIWLLGAGYIMYISFKE